MRLLHKIFYFLISVNIFFLINAFAGDIYDSRSAYGTKHQVKIGTKIKLKLVDSINVSKPGRVTTEVVQNIYDSTTSKKLLIPKGSKLLGKYKFCANMNSQYQAHNISMWFTHIVTPNNHTITLDESLDGNNLLKDFCAQKNIDSYWDLIKKATTIVAFISTDSTVLPSNYRFTVTVRKNIDLAL